MTLGEMIDEVLVVLPFDVEHSRIIRLLNRAQEHESRDLLIPQYYSEVTDVTGTFALPAGAREEGLLEVRRNSDGTRYPIYNTQQADLRYAGWKEWDAGSTTFIVFDPKMAAFSGSVRPVPLPKSTDPQDYVITYTATPTTMTSLSDEPWDGHLPSYHQLLPLRVTFELLMGAGADLWQPYYQRYSELRGDAFDATRPRVYTGNNLIYKEVMADGTS